VTASGIGMNSRIAGSNAQGTADRRASVSSGLATNASGVTVKQVMEFRSPAAWTICQFRYPSPLGRSCAAMCGPSIFFAESGSCAHGRWIADIALLRRVRFDARPVLPSCAVTCSMRKRGEAELCQRIEQTQRNNRAQYSLQPWLRLPVWRPVARQSPNRPFWAAAQGRSPGLWWGAASSPAQPSARRATSSTVRPIRIAADELTRVARTARADAIPATAVSGSGGLFHVKRQTGQARAHARPRLARRDR